MPVFDFSESSNPLAKKIENNNIIQQDDDDLTSYDGSGDESMPSLESFPSDEINNKICSYIKKDKTKCDIELLEEDYKKGLKVCRLHQVYEIYYNQDEKLKNDDKKLENKNIENDDKIIKTLTETVTKTYENTNLLEFKKYNNIKYIEEKEEYDLYEIFLEHEKNNNTKDYQEYLKDDDEDYYCEEYGELGLDYKHINQLLRDMFIINNTGRCNEIVNEGLFYLLFEIKNGLKKDYKYITLKDYDDNIYIYHEKDINQDDIINELTIIENGNSLDTIKNNNYLNPFLQYKINKFKNKIKNNKLKKDLKFKIKGKQYTFSSNYIDETVRNTKKEKKVYSKSNYFDKYKSRISDNNIKELDKNIKNNELKNNEFWDNYYKNKNKNKDKINSLFKDDPVINFDKELFYEKYKDKHYSVIYKDILLELDKLEKDYNNFKNIENCYNKLKEDINIKSVFKNNSNKINMLFTDYENNRVNEYKVMSEIGELIVNNKLSKEEMKEINSLNENSRPARVIKQSKRIYILNKFVDIKNIALSGISNWLRDTSDDNFELLVSFFST